MKKIVLFISIILMFSLLSFSLATDESTMYYYNNESGELVESDKYELDDDAVLLDNEEDLQSLYGEQELNDKEETQEDLRKDFLDQQSEIIEIKEEKMDKKFVVTNVLSDIKTEYIRDSYYVYIIKYQVLNIRTEDDEIPAVAILSYDISDNKNIKPVKVGDTLYGYVEKVSSDDSNFYMINHGLKDEEIAYVSISSQDRTLGVILLTTFTILLIGLYAGKKGMKLLIPIFIILDLLFIVFVPELEIGRSALILSSAISLEIIILITVLKNGWSKKTLVALISSIIVVVLVATLRSCFWKCKRIYRKRTCF